jgi:ABC-type branched-subunit amino acid transport system substrate-binding protein
VVNVPNIYTIVPSLLEAIHGSTQYVFSKYHPKSVGVFHTTDAAGNADAATAEALLRSDGVKNVSDQSAAITATDVTEQALAMKSESVVMSFGYPLVEGVFATALSQNAITLPVSGDDAIGLLAGDHLNTPAELKNYTFSTYCYPPVLSTPQSKAYVKAYRAALNKELSKITFQGACGTYKSDGVHDMMNQVAIVSLAGGFSATNYTPGTLAAKYQEKSLTKSQLKAAASSAG